MVGGVGWGVGGGDFVLDQVVDLVGVVLDGGGDIGGGRVHDAVVDGVLVRNAINNLITRETYSITS